jgi:hypothetical protein
VTRQSLHIDGVGFVVVFAFVRGQGQQQPGQVLATIDQSDIRGSKPHNLDPSGAAVSRQFIIWSERGIDSDLNGCIGSDFELRGGEFRGRIQP